MNRKKWQKAVYFDTEPLPTVENVIVASRTVLLQISSEAYQNPQWLQAMDTVK